MEEMISNMNNPFSKIDYNNEHDVAYIYNGKKVINKVLDIKTRIFLRALFEKGEISNIAIILDRTDNLIIALLACLIGGYIYIPIDPLLPQNRIIQMLECSSLDLIVTSSKYYENYKSRYSILCIDEVFSSINSFTEKSIPIRNINDIAYTIYTSGTTGKPKGVEITREALWNFISGVSEIIDFTRGKRILCSTTGILEKLNLGRIADKWTISENELFNLSVNIMNDKVIKSSCMRMSEVFLNTDGYVEGVNCILNACMQN